MILKLKFEKIYERMLLLVKRAKQSSDFLVWSKTALESEALTSVGGIRENNRSLICLSYLLNSFFCFTLSLFSFAFIFCILVKI